MIAAPMHSHEPPTHELKLDGLHCASCAHNVEAALEQQPGVTSVVVSLTQARASISGHNIDAATLVQAVTAAGYGATVITQRQAPAELRSDLEQRQTANERQWRQRALVGLSIWIPMLVLHWTMHEEATWLPWVLCALGTIVIITVGGGFYRSAWQAARNRTTNMDTLIAIGATTAYAYSLVLFIIEQTGRETGQPLYFSEAAALFGIISLGHWMEARSSAKAGSAVRELLELQPETAERMESDGSIFSLPSAAVQIGDRILIRPGTRVPVDGMIVEGESDLDESVVTGEPLPRLRRSGEPVVSGSMNTSGRLVVEATVDGRNTTVARIAELVTDAMATKANIQRLADTVSSIFVPVIIAIALLTGISWTITALVLGDTQVFLNGIIAVVTVLIISCPCALGLATPMAIMVGASESSRLGILIKSAAAFEIAGNATDVVFDKTGTLTIGRPQLVAIDVTDPTFDETSLIRLAAAAEASSEHPIGRAIVDAAAQRKLSLPPATDFSSSAGQGVIATVEGRRIEVGRDTEATCRVLVDGTCAGRLTMADEPRKDAASAVAALHALGIRVHMLSGDRLDAAQCVAHLVGIAPDAVHAEQSPESKSAFLKQIEGRSIMVGDGINDAGALATADVGISLGSGTNIAIEAASVVVPGDHVHAIPSTIQIARLTLRAIKQNLFFAFFYNAAMVPIAALGLLGAAGPLIAAAAMGCSDITVIGNAIRLRWSIRRHVARMNEKVDDLD
jgi:Cu+-exporting ATPase